MQTATTFPVLRVGDQGALVVGLQTLLNQRLSTVYNPIIEPLVLDGEYGPKTRSVVQVAQFRYLLFQDGIAGSQTWRSLQGNKVLVDEFPTLQWGSQGQVVTVLQKTLGAKAVGAIDGVLGDRTEAAVKDYQTTSNLVVDGVVGPNTWRSLEYRALSQLI